MFLEIVRYAVFGIAVLAGAAAAGSWAIRTRRLNPFGRVGQIIRRTTDPILQPIENWIHRRGGNPQNAETWLVGGAIGGGILLVGVGTVLNDVIVQFAQTQPRNLLPVTLAFAARVVSWAVFIRVIGSWFGLHRFTPYAKPVFFLTDWIVEPLRRWIPPIGNIDAAPFVAFILLQAVISILT
jgi:uncharacterized protein YggT (Ycf19 family)